MQVRHQQLSGCSPLTTSVLYHCPVVRMQSKSVYLQLLGHLVVVGDGCLESLEEIQLCLELPPHAAGPPVPVSLVLSLAQVDQLGPAGVSGLDLEQPAVRVMIHLLLQLHLVHLLYIKNVTVLFVDRRAFLVGCFQEW